MTVSWFFRGALRRHVTSLKTCQELQWFLCLAFRDGDAGVSGDVGLKVTGKTAS